MPRIICPVCNKVTSVSPHIGDFICDCSTSDSLALREEDVLVLGAWEDFSGSGGNTNFNRGAENKLQGRRAEVECNTTHDLTPRGNIETLYRQRKRLTYMEIDDNGCTRHKNCGNR